MNAHVPISLFPIAAQAPSVPSLCPCPGCGAPPAIDPSFFDEVCIFCDNDLCEGVGDGWAQAMGVTLEEAAEKWNAVGTELPYYNPTGPGGVK